MASNAVARSASSASSSTPVINVISPGASSSSHPNIGSFSSSSQATSSAVPLSGMPPMADPLPTKVGEIGYMSHEEDNNDGTSSMDGMNAAEADARNGRHPADRSQTNIPGTSSSSSRNASHTTINMPMPPKSVTSRIWSKKFGGISVRAITQFTIVFLLISGTIVGWVFSALSVTHDSHNNNGGQNNNNSNSMISPVFLNLLFAVVVIIELIVLERTVFRIRAERYAHMHPGEMLPLHRNAATAQIAARGMPFAPWNRPSLPTYAAALGFRGTGDVEDNLIAAPPPPAYGNTRGSTLLLTTLIQNRSRSSLTGLRESTDEEDSPSRRVSMHFSEESHDSMSELQPQTVARTSNERPGRPVSYNTSEYQSNLQQAQRLGEALSRPTGTRDSEST